jgi:hypothetical protein
MPSEIISIKSKRVDFQSAGANAERRFPMNTLTKIGTVVAAAVLGVAGASTPALAQGHGGHGGGGHGGGGCHGGGGSRGGGYRGGGYGYRGGYYGRGGYGYSYGGALLGGLVAGAALDPYYGYGYPYAYYGCGRVWDPYRGVYVPAC